MYDIIVVGARVAGSSTAMLLARKGYRVLLVDKATFPSDTLSTHQIQVPGGALLKRWGLLDKIRSTNPGIAARAQLDIEPIVLKGTFPALDGVNAVHSPRRTVLDKILIDAAVEAGVELRESFTTEELILEDEGVCGIRGRSGTTTSITESARLVIGADGKHSLVAKAVKASKYHEHPVLTCAYYGYWDGVPVEMGEMYGRGPRSIGVWPTNGGLTMIYTAWPVAEFQQYRNDVEGNYLKTVDLIPSLAARVHAGRLAEPIRGTADLPNFFRKPYGPGWALVGDAGLVRDPITGRGIGEAFRDAELLATAIDDGFAGRQPIMDALAGYEQRRNEAALPGYQLTLDLASMKPPTVEQQVLFQALATNQGATDQFFGVLTGVVPAQTFFAGRNMFRIIGLRGMATITLGKMFASRGGMAQPATRQQVSSQG